METWHDVKLYLWAIEVGLGLLIRDFNSSGLQGEYFVWTSHRCLDKRQSFIHTLSLFFLWGCACRWICRQMKHARNTELFYDVKWRCRYSRPHVIFCECQGKQIPDSIVNHPFIVEKLPDKLFSVYLFILQWYLIIKKEFILKVHSIEISFNLILKK